MLPTAPRRARVEAPSVSTGRVGLVRLGVSRVFLQAGECAPSGCVVSWAAPWFTVVDARGVAQRMRASKVAARLAFSAADFYQPRAFHYDFDVIHPAKVGGWSSELRLFVRWHRIIVPSVWLDPKSAPEETILGQGSGRAGAGDWDDGGMLGARDFCAREQARLGDEFQRLAGATRGPGTIRGFRTPGLKLLWFGATREFEYPPTQRQVTDYLTWLAVETGVAGAISAARGALLHLCRINDWDTLPYKSGVALIPGAAMARLTRHQVKKSEGISLAMVERILERYCHLRAVRATSGQWELAFGVAVIVGYKVLARWDDLRQLRWDESYCEVTELNVRFYLEHRKNAMHNGNFVDVARRRDGQRGAYEAIVAAWRFFRSGYVLPYISSRGEVDTTRWMPYGKYVQHLRQSLVQIGVSSADSMTFAGQSARSGAATTCMREGVEPHQLCRMAGVKSINWGLGYMRPDFEDRLGASRAMGL